MARQAMIPQSKKSKIRQTAPRHFQSELAENAPLPGYILCGGQSRRFGSDKARFPLEGVPLIQRISQTLASQHSSVIAVADSPGKYADLGLQTIADQTPDQGPLFGLATALTHARDELHAEWILLLSCDLTELHSDWLTELKTARQRFPTARALIFEEISPNLPDVRRRHPFPGCYHISLNDILCDGFPQGIRSFQRFFDSLADALICLPVPQHWPPVPQINTPADYQDWKRLS